MDVSELILRTADTGLCWQRDDGSFPAGKNGPYGNTDTPVRNTSHWSITLTEAYVRSGEKSYLEGVHGAMDFLTSKDCRPHGYSFKHRDREYEGQDQTNGLIGQAWTIESLAVVAGIVDRPGLLDLAAETFLLHPFNEETALWRIIDTNGEVLGYDATFNHQLWFAMSGGLLAEQLASNNHEDHEAVEDRVRAFLDNLGVLMRTFPNGLIIHPLLPSNPRTYIRNVRVNREFQASIFKKWVKMVFFKAVNTWKARSTSQILKKSIPYHPFNLYALGILKDLYPEASIWQSDKFHGVYRYSKRDSFLESLEGDQYAYAYNPPGFELPFFWSIIEGSISDISKGLFKKQLRHSYNFEKNVMINGTDDKYTHAARFYECTRLPNFELGDMP